MSDDTRTDQNETEERIKLERDVKHSMISTFNFDYHIFDGYRELRHKGAEFDYLRGWHTKKIQMTSGRIVKEDTMSTLTECEAYTVYDWRKGKMITSHDHLKERN